MTSGLVHLGYSLPEGQARKLNFFVPCLVQNVSYNKEFTLHKNERAGKTYFHMHGFAQTLVDTEAKDNQAARCPRYISLMCKQHNILSLWHLPASWPLVWGKLKMCTDLDPSIRHRKDTATSTTITDEWIPCHRNIVCTIIIRTFFFLMPVTLSSLGVHFFGTVFTRTLPA